MLRFALRKLTVPLLSLCGWAVLATSTTSAQMYRGSSIVYLVRDEKGKIIDPMELESITTAPGAGMESTSITPIKPDDTEGEKEKCLRISTMGEKIHLTEITLKYHGKTMRLVFDLTAQDVEKVVDSLPFRQGIFKLSVDGKTWTEVH